MATTVPTHEADGKTPNGAVDADTSKPKRSVRTIFLKNSSPVPNWFFDEVLADSQVPHATRSVLLFLLRKTVGWSNRVEDLSLSEIQRGASVSRHVAIHAVRVICECWGLFYKSRGAKGQHSSSFRIADLTADHFLDRSLLVYGIYGTIHPSPKQLRERPCTTELLRWQRKKDAEEFGEQDSSGASIAPQ